MSRMNKMNRTLATYNPGEALEFKAGSISDEDFERKTECTRTDNLIRISMLPA